MRPALAIAYSLLAGAALAAEGPEVGRRLYESVCSRCHGADGSGGEHGPAIVSRLAPRNDAELAALIREGLPAAGMPGFPLPDGEVGALVAHLRTLRPLRGRGPERVQVQTTEGRTVQGLALNQTSTDMQ